MPKPKNVEITLQEALFRMHNSGVLKYNSNSLSPDEVLLPLPERIQRILGIVKKQPGKTLL